MLRRFISLFAAATLTAGLGLAGATPAQAAPGDPVPVPGSSAPAEPMPELGKPTKAIKGKGILKGKPEAGLVASANPATCGTPPCFFHAGKRQDSMTADGASVSLQINNPYFKTGDGHTLGEMAVESADGQQLVEVGWTRDPAVNGGSSAPHLFVASWTNGSFNGYNGGGGYTPVGGCSPCAGSNLTAAIGTSPNFAIQHIADGAGGITDGWWVAYGANWIGVFPDTTWTTPTYTQSGLIQVFGEVGKTSTSEPCDDMGNGTFTSGTGATATSFALVNGSVGTAWNGTIQTDSTKYDAANASGTSMEYGGPGWNSIGTATGVTGSCAPSTAGTAPASTMQFWQEVCPDGSATGCTAGVAYTAVGTTLNACNVVTAGSIINAYKNNSGVSGRSYNIYKTSGCTGSTILITNAASGSLIGTGFEDTNTHGVVRRG